MAFFLCVTASLFGIASSQVLSNTALRSSVLYLEGGDESKRGSVASINRRSAPARSQKQITVTSSEGAGANHFCKTWKYPGERAGGLGGDSTSMYSPRLCQIV